MTCRHCGFPLQDNRACTCLDGPRPSDEYAPDRDLRAMEDSRRSRRHLPPAELDASRPLPADVQGDYVTHDGDCCRDELPCTADDHCTDDQPTRRTLTLAEAYANIKACMEDPTDDPHDDGVDDKPTGDPFPDVRVMHTATITNVTEWNRLVNDLDAGHSWIIAPSVEADYQAGDGVLMVSGADDDHDYGTIAGYVTYVAHREHVAGLKRGTVILTLGHLSPAQVTGTPEA